MLCTHWGDFNLEKCVSDVTRFHKFFIIIYYILDKSIIRSKIKIEKIIINKNSYGIDYDNLTKIFKKSYSIVKIRTGKKGDTPQIQYIIYPLSIIGIYVLIFV